MQIFSCTQSVNRQGLSAQPKSEFSLYAPNSPCMTSNRPAEGRKRPHDSALEGLRAPTKKLRLDNLLEGLSLDDSERGGIRSTSYSVNPSLKLNKVYKKSQNASLVSNIDSYISERLFEHFSHVLQASGALIAWYNAPMLVMYYFQKWVLRLFNRFSRRYCKMTGQKPRRFRRYSNVIQLIEAPDNNLTAGSLLEILIEETLLELGAIKRRRLESDQVLEAAAAKETRYDYWAHMGPVQGDLDLDYGRIEELGDLDVADMEVEHETGPQVSNYGLYYRDYDEEMAD